MALSLKWLRSWNAGEPVALRRFSLAGGLAAWRLPSHGAASQCRIIVENILVVSSINDNGIVAVILFIFYPHLLLVLC